MYFRYSLGGNYSLWHRCNFLGSTKTFKIPCQLSTEEEFCKVTGEDATERCDVEGSGLAEAKADMLMAARSHMNAKHVNWF